MTQATLDSLQHGYSTLFFHDDPRVELLMVENQVVQPFNHQRPASGAGREVSQRNMLMVGHLTSGIFARRCVTILTCPWGFLPARHHLERRGACAGQR